MKKRVLSALFTLFFLAALCPVSGMCTSGGGGGAAAVIRPASYYRPSDPVMAEAYDLGLLGWIQPQSNYDSFVGNPSEGLTRLECVELLAAFCNLAVRYAGNNFSDTGNLSITQRAVITAIAREEMMAGFSDNTFRPDNILTKGAGCKVLCNALFGAEYYAYWYSQNTSPFPDVQSGSTFAGAIEQCKKYGIITADADGNFHPADPLSRKSMVEWLLAAVEAREGMPDYLFAFAPRNAENKDIVTSGSVGTVTELAVYVRTKQPYANAVYAAAFYEGNHFKGMGSVPETLNQLSAVVYIPLGAGLSGSTTVKLYALDANTLRPFSPPAVFDLMP